MFAFKVLFSLAVLVVVGFVVDDLVSFYHVAFVLPEKAKTLMNSYAQMRVIGDSTCTAFASGLMLTVWEEN